jgi:hypothetical protein
MEKRLLVQDLYQYLLELTVLLRNGGQSKAAERVLHVSKFASGSTSELYGEARLLLPAILGNEGAMLSELEKARLREVIEGVEREFGRVGGA